MQVALSVEVRAGCCNRNHIETALIGSQIRRASKQNEGTGSWRYTKHQAFIRHKGNPDDFPLHGTNYRFGGACEFQIRPCLKRLGRVGA